MSTTPVTNTDATNPECPVCEGHTTATLNSTTAVCFVCDAEFNY